MTFVNITFGTLILLSSIVFILFYKHFNNSDSKSKFGFWFDNLLTVLALFAIYFMAFVSYNSFLKEYGNTNLINENILYWLPISLSIIVLYLSDIFYYDYSYSLRAKVDDRHINKMPFQKSFIPVKTKEVKNLKISTYPRFTVYAETKSDKHEEIFDSSDFEIINKTFGAYEEWPQRIRISEDIELDNKTYYVKDFRLEFMEGFYDYSNHAPKGYKGKKVPHNLRIIIVCKELPPTTTPTASTADKN